MATREDIYRAMRKADAAGDAEAVRKLGAYLQTMDGPTKEQRIAEQTAKDRAEFDPTKGMGTGERLAAGIGGGMTSVIRALGGDRAAGALGLPSRAEAAQLDKPLDATTAGTVGKMIGVAAPAALAIPFTPATFAGAGLAGGLTGALMTEGDAGDRALGGGMGALGGLAGQAIPKVAGAGWGMLKGLVEPFRQGGRERIAGRTLGRFVTDADALAHIKGGRSITGARPTLAEAARDPGLASLERAIGQLDPQAEKALAARQMANNAARLESLRAVSGGATQPASKVRRLNQIATGQPTREAAEGTRSAAAGRSYGEAFDAGIDPDAAFSLAPQLNSILERPSVRSGVARAKGMAQEAGIAIDDPGSVQGLHYLKQALDDQVSKLRDQPSRQRLVQQTSKDLGSVLEEIAPLYQTARREFQNNSVPVNRAAVGERLVEGAKGALRDFGGDRKLQANAFARALNDEGELLKQSGVKGGANALDDLLTATQSGRVNAVRDELETVANLSNAANGAGSQTAKALASQNLMRQIAGPLGLPESFSESVIGQTLGRAPQFAFKAAEPRIQEAIAKGLIDPEEGLRLIRLARLADARKGTTALQQLAGRSAPAAIGGLSAYGAGQ